MFRGLSTPYSKGTCKRIIVRGEETREGRSPQILVSEGLGPCIALGVISGGWGIIDHRAPIGWDYKKHVISFFDEVERRTEGNVANIYVAGGTREGINDSEI